MSIPRGRTMIMTITVKVSERRIRCSRMGACSLAVGPGGTRRKSTLTPSLPDLNLRKGTIRMLIVIMTILLTKLSGSQ